MSCKIKKDQSIICDRPQKNGVERTIIKNLYYEWSIVDI